MKLLFTVMLGFTFLCLATPGAQAQMTPESQAQPQTHEPSPREVVEQLWGMATQGYLLKRDDARRAAGLFTQPGAAPKTRKFAVISNGYWVDRPQFEGTTAKVMVEYYDIGSIDSVLRFTPVPPSHDPCSMGKTFVVYDLVFAPSRLRMVGADGKTFLREAPSLPEWQIKGSPQPPFATVNTAIRYVLERRRKATDPAIQQNADRTMAVLLRYH